MPIGFMGSPLIEQFYSLPESIKKRNLQNEVFTPKEDALNELISLIKQRPIRTEPSKKDKIFAALSSLSGFSPAAMAGGNPVGIKADVPLMNKIQEEMLYKNYNRDLSDWESAIDPALKLANIESQRNTGDRLAFDQRMQERRLNERLDLDRLKADAQSKYQMGQNEARNREIKRKEDYDAFRRAQASNPNFKSFIDQDGIVVLVDMKDPTNIIRTDVDTKSMSDLEKAEFGRTSQLMALRERIKGASDLEDKKQTNRVDLLNKKNEASTTDKALSPSQEARAKYNRANDVKNLYPELAPYIKLGPNMVVDIPSVSKINELLGRRNEADRKKAIDLLYPQGSKNLTGINNETKSNNATPGSNERPLTEDDIKAALRRDGKNPDDKALIDMVRKQWIAKGLVVK